MNFKNKVTISLAASDTDTSINSLKGIDRMTGIRALSLQNITLSPDYFVREIEYISKITNLSILNLSNTGIYDQTGSNAGTPQGTSNNILETLSALSNLEELYLANNKIYSFAALANFASLKKVDISYNLFTSNVSDSSWLDFLDDILTDLVNSLYGTWGVNNISVISCTKCTLIFVGPQIAY
jgi:Leucine-rich repeat (LRR) protein